MTRIPLLTGFFVFIAIFFASPLQLNATTPDATTVEPQKYNADEPLVTERQYFTYHGLSSRNVTLRTFKGFDAHRMMKLMGSNPQSALDHLGMLILVQKALEGIDVAAMSTKDLDRLVEENITAALMQIGRESEARALYPTEEDEQSRMPSVASMVNLLESVSYKLVRGIYHIRPLLSNPNLHTNG